MPYHLITIRFKYKVSNVLYRQCFSRIRFHASAKVFQSLTAFFHFQWTKISEFRNFDSSKGLQKKRNTWTFECHVYYWNIPLQKFFITIKISCSCIICQSAEIEKLSNDPFFSWLIASFEFKKYPLYFWNVYVQAFHFFSTLTSSYTHIYSVLWDILIWSDALHVIIRSLK